MNLKRVILKIGKDKAIRHKHHWIFSGAIQSCPEFNDGDLLPVYSASGDLLGSGFFNNKSMIKGRMVSFDDRPPLEAIKKNLNDAIAMRHALFDLKRTNAFRLINGEGDNLPGLIVDQYNNVIVIQIATKGMDNLRSFIIDTLYEKLNPLCIYEKSSITARKDEGLIDSCGFRKGTSGDLIEILENGLKFRVSLENSQKTGFFLDHREMRQLIFNMARGKRVLNAFSYTGGFTISALAGGATHVDSVDISSKANELAEQNVTLNQFPLSACHFYTDDVFDFLRQQPLNYEVVILDPPAFAKKQKDVIQACRGYKDINRLAIQKMPSQSLLLTSSCSYHVDDKLFQQVIFQAAAEAKRSVRIIGRHRLAFDHPINIFHPEGDYLKSLLLYIN